MTLMAPKAFCLPTVLAPWGVNNYDSGTAQAVLDHAESDARLIFSCGWHITRDGLDVYSWRIKALVSIVGRIARLLRAVDLDDQVEACRFGVGMWATPSSPAISRAEWTSRCSWWPRSKMIASSGKPLRSLGAGRPR